jgi:ABC-2 type transport system ATP-binding protein
MAEAMIEVEVVGKRFGSTVALDDIDLVTERGKVLALLGPNGAGKTTLARIPTTLLRPDSGRARVAGYSPSPPCAPSLRLFRNRTS